MDVEKREELFTTRNICINWVVIWPWEQGHSSPTKGHIDFVNYRPCVEKLKNPTSVVKTVVAAEKHCLGMPPLPLPRIRSRVICVVCSICIFWLKNGTWYRPKFCDLTTCMCVKLSACFVSNLYRLLIFLWVFDFKMKYLIQIEIWATNCHLTSITRRSLVEKLITLIFKLDFGQLIVNCC